MSEQRWCEHLIKYDGGYDFYPNTSEPEYYGTISKNWKMCPICGTMRPKEMNLEEKFRQKFKLLDEYFDNACEELAKIADEHHRRAK
jgi:hypothetical protein